MRKVTFFLLLTLVCSVFVMGCNNTQNPNDVSSKEIALTDEGKNATGETTIDEAASEEIIKDFRNVAWGMKMSEVEKAENDAIFIGKVEENERLLYKTNLDGLDFQLGYEFVDNKLFRAIYFLESEHTNKNAYINDFKSFKDILKEKYGEPIRDDVIWKRNLYKDDPDDWGFAVSLGHLAFKTDWQTPRTDISIFLTGDNYEIVLGIVYSSNEFSELQKEKVKEETKSKL